MTDAARRWVAERTPAAPPALATFVADALGDAAGDLAAEGDVEAIARACLRAGERSFIGVLSRDARDRDAARGIAHELLTADALVTYAFEAAAEAPERLGALAREAMAELSRVGVGGP